MDMIAAVLAMSEAPVTEMEPAPVTETHLVVETVAVTTEVVVAPVTKTPKVDPKVDIFPEYVLKGNIQPIKLPHRNLVLDDVCTACAHCGMALTDQVSIQRAVGPICSKRGYKEDPVDGDELQAMIDLAEWPEVVEFLTKNYKPLGMRGLVNGLVRLAALNRPRGKGRLEGNFKLHGDICCSLHSLGYVKIASLLRETLATVFVKTDPATGVAAVRVKKSEWTPQYSNEMRVLPGVGYDKMNRSYLVPVHAPGDPKAPVLHHLADGSTTSVKRMFWGILLRHYEGAVAKTADGGAFVIKQKT